MKQSQNQLQISFPAQSRANRIIGEFYSSPMLNRLIGKMNPPELRDDLRQELIIVLLGKDERLIESLHDNKQLAFYATRIVLNMVRSVRSPFHYTYRKDTPIEFDDNHANAYGYDDMEEGDALARRREAEECEAVMVSGVFDMLNAMPWYDRELFNLWRECDENAAEVQRLTGIPSRSVLVTVNKVREQLKQVKQ